MTELREGAALVVRRLWAEGFQAFWVGGCVRDLVMGREARDYDIATDARPGEVVRLFPDALLVGVRFGVVTVPSKGHSYEVTTFRTEGPYLDGRRPSRVEFADAEVDVRRRDFTINGLLFDPREERLIDYVGGREDIARRRIRTIGPPRVRLEEDRLRMLRAVRLAAELDFEIEGETLQAITACAPGITRVSGERIRDELARLITCRGRGRGVDLLKRSGLLERLLPEVSATVGVAQPPEFHPEGDVFTHTVLTLQNLDRPRLELALAALLHDVGKPPTYEELDRIRFNRHDEMGARLAEAICRRLRLSGRQTEQVVRLVRDHIRIKDLPKMRPARARRFLAREDLEDHLELHRADCLASHGDLSVWHWAMETLSRLSGEHKRPTPLLTGRHLVEMGYEPGPRFRAMLDFAFDAQLEGEIFSLEEARELVRRRFPESGGGR